MNTGLTEKEFNEYFSNEKTISLEAIKNFEKLYGIDYKFLNTDSFIIEDYGIINNSLDESILATEEENHFLAASFHIYFELYRDSNSLTEVITLLTEDNLNFLKDFMLQHDLNIDFFNKLFELHPSTIKYFKSQKVYE